MLSPFPGMNPYLEHPNLWQGVHKRLIVAIADAMNPQLRPRYRMEIEERVYETQNEDSLLVGIPDNAVIQTSRKSPRSHDSNLAVAAPPIQPVTVTIPLFETVSEWYLQVRKIETNEVITVIEILSPKNKRPGEGREKYEAKRQKILGSSTHLIEIDLLRQGKIMAMEPENIDSHYRILVSRSYARPKADLYVFNLQDAIPSIPLPLQSGEPDLMIPLPDLLQEIYDKGSYDLEINYQDEPVPPLAEVDAVWADTLLRQKGLR
jgi:hypothetical protein